MTEQHTTAERRAELRRRYGSPPDGVVRCTVCREMMEVGAPEKDRISGGVLWTWRCPRASEHPRQYHIDHYSDLDVLAAVDDADTLVRLLAYDAERRAQSVDLAGSSADVYDVVERLRAQLNACCLQCDALILRARDALRGSTNAAKE